MSQAPLDQMSFQSAKTRRQGHAIRAWPPAWPSQWGLLLGTSTKRREHKWTGPSKGTSTPRMPASEWAVPMDTATERRCRWFAHQWECLSLKPWRTGQNCPNHFPLTTSATDTAAGSKKWFQTKAQWAQCLAQQTINTCKLKCMISAQVLLTWLTATDLHGWENPWASQQSLLKQNWFQGKLIFLWLCPSKYNKLVFPRIDSSLDFLRWTVTES